MATEALEKLARNLRSIALISTDSFCFTNYRAEFIRDLVERGVRVYAVGRHDRAGAAAVAALGAIPVHLDVDSTGMNPVADAAYVLRLVIALRRIKPDATFAFFTKPLMLGSIAARIARVPQRFAMVSGLGYAYTQNGVRQRLARAALALMCALGLKACHRVIFENDDDLRFFRSRGMVGHDRSARVPGSGVNTGHFAPVPLPDAPLFLMIGRPLAEKGVREFAEAARIVSQSHPEARFVLLGGCTDNPGCLSASEIRAMKAIQWIGQVPDVRPWIACASAVVLPSYREGLPRSVLEAMAMARPVIATDVPGCREAVTNGRNGLLVPPRDPEALAGAMRAMLDDPVTAKTMSIQGLNMARDRFDVAKVNAAIFAEIAHSEGMSGAIHPETEMVPAASIGSCVRTPAELV